MNIPFHDVAFARTASAFTKWLKAKGAEMRNPTNEWEVLRYALDGTVSIIYKNKRGTLNYTGNSYAHIQEFLGNRRRLVMPGPNMQQISKIESTCGGIEPLLKKWGRIETDPPCEPAEYCSQPEDRGQPSTDHCEDVPWE